MPQQRLRPPDLYAARVGRLPPDSPFAVLLPAFGVNDERKMVGFGATTSGDVHAFLAVPCDGEESTTPNACAQRVPVILSPERANCRYQQSEPGRDSHRRCQQRYRERASQPVTDQAIVPIASPVAPQRATVCRCAMCGRHSLWIDPFPSVPRRYRSAGRSKKDVFR